MKAFTQGKIVELTEEQEKEFLDSVKNIPVDKSVTDKDRISALESAFADLAVMLVGGVNND